MTVFFFLYRSFRNFFRLLALFISSLLFCFFYFPKYKPIKTHSSKTEFCFPARIVPMVASRLPASIYSYNFPSENNMFSTNEVNKTLLLLLLLLLLLTWLTKYISPFKSAYNGDAIKQSNIETEQNYIPTYVLKR